MSDELKQAIEIAKELNEDAYTKDEYFAITTLLEFVERHSELDQKIIYWMDLASNTMESNPAMAKKYLNEAKELVKSRHNEERENG